MAALAGLAEQVDRAPCHHLPTMTYKRFQNFLEVQYPGLAIDQCHHINTEYRLQAGLGIQVIQHHVTNFTATQFDDHAHAILVGFVTQLGNTFYLLLFDQLGYALDQARLVQLIGKLVDENDVLASLLIVNHFSAGTHINATATRAVGLNNSRAPIDDARRGKIGARNVLHQLIDSQVRITD